MKGVTKSTHLVPATPIRYNVNAQDASPVASLNSLQWLGTFNESLTAWIKENKDRKPVSFVPDSHIVENLEGIYQFIHEIGTGSTCRVVLATNVETNKYVALKQMRKDDEVNLEAFETEYKILSKLRHPNIASFHNCYIDTYNYYIATDYCAGGELLDYVSKMKTFSESQASECIKTVIKAIKYCHNKNISHRDLKPGNLIFDKKPSLDYFQTDENDTQNNNSLTVANGSGQSSPNSDQTGQSGQSGQSGNNSKAKLKIIDFGLAIEIDENDSNDEYVGTLLYMPPESTGEREGWELQEGDMWSIGIITYVLVCGVPPFKGVNHARTLLAIMTQDIPWPDENEIELSDACKQFISKLLEKDPRMRYSAEEALRDPWLNQNKRNSTRHLGDTFKKNLKNYDKLERFEYLVKDKTMRDFKDISEDDKKVIQTQIKELDSNNDGEIEKPEVLNYLIKKGMKKEVALTRVDAVFQMLKICTTQGILDIRDYRMVTPAVSPEKGNMGTSVGGGKSLVLGSAEFRPSKRMSTKHLVLSEDPKENEQLFSSLLNVTIEENDERDFDDLLSPTQESIDRAKKKKSSIDEERASGLSVAIAKKKNSKQTIEESIDSTIKESNETTSLIDKKQKNQNNKSKTELGGKPANSESNIDTISNSNTQYQRLANDETDEEAAAANKKNSMFSCFCCG